MMKDRWLKLEFAVLMAISLFALWQVVSAIVAFVSALFWYLPAPAH